MGQMSRLDAVNQCLLAAGEAIVSDLDNQSGVDTSICEYLLENYTQDFQMRGLANNQYLKKMTPDENNDYKILLPQNIISLNFASYVTNGLGEHIRVSIKKEGENFILWNVTEQTSNWEDYISYELCAEFIVEVDWEDIDTPGQRAIVASAARRYQMLTQGDGAMDAYLQQDELIFNMKGRSRDFYSQDRNIWNASSYQTKRAVYRPAGGRPNFRLWRART